MRAGLLRVGRRAAVETPREPYHELLRTKSEVQLDMQLRARRPPRYPNEAKRRLDRVTAPPQPLAFALRELPPDHDPLVPLGGVEHLPFFVERSASGNLPVYRDYRLARSVKRTVVRRVSGDFEALMAELSKVTSNSPVSAHVGSLVVEGLHSRVISEYLMRLGF